MKRVLKYKVSVREESEIGVGKVVLAEYDPTDDDTLFVWVEVDLPSNWPVWAENKRTVAVAGTGHPILYDERHLISVRSGVFVWHIYEVV